MKRVIDIDMETKCKKFETALNRFFKKYPELEYWKEEFEYMHGNDEDFTCDNKYGDGTYNKDWRYALHLDEYDGTFYFAVIERA